MRRFRRTALWGLFIVLLAFAGSYFVYDSLLDRAVDFLTQPPRKVAPPAEIFWKSHNMAVTDVEWKSRDGLRLSGEYVHAPKTPRGTLVIAHGLGDSRLPWRKRVIPWLQEGWDVFLFDQRGHGRSGGSGTMGCREAGDMADALNRLESLKLLRAPLVVLGHSLGGVSALRLAALDPRVKGLILASTYLNVQDISEHFLHGFTGYEWARRFTPGLFDRMIRKTGCKIDQFDPRTIADKVKVPTLLIHGKADVAVPVEMGKQLARALSEAPLDRLFLEDTGHVDVFEAQDLAATKKVAAFLSQF